MPNCDKLLERARLSQANFRFEDLCSLAECYGFALDHIRGSHHIYKRPGWPKVMNFQNRKGKAPRYQIRELLNAIDLILAGIVPSEE
jgi:predicted RNA binding protein YcfA (HicA-like mRNA interferase family)